MEQSSLVAIFFITLGLSYLKALSGLGAAGLLVPIYIWFGLPLNTAKSTALLANTTSLSAATFDNFRSSRIDVKLGLPIILSSFLVAPLGAYISTYIDKEVLLWMFVVFLILTGMNALRPRKSNNKPVHDSHPRLLYLSLIGGFAGLISGLLGVGGGGVIAASMLWLGCNAKKIAVITAFAVPFSSFSGFIAYAAGGHISWVLLITIGTAALLGGFVGNKTMHSVLPDKFVKYMMGVVSLLFASKLIFDMMH